MIDITSLDGIHQLPPTSPVTQARSIGEVSGTPRGAELRVSEPSGSKPRGTDTVEISNEALALSRAAATSSLRVARNNAIRSEIKAGSYETPERINQTVERLLDILT